MKPKFLINFLQHAFVAQNLELIHIFAFIFFLNRCIKCHNIIPKKLVCIRN